MTQTDLLERQERKNNVIVVCTSAVKKRYPGNAVLRPTGEFISSFYFEILE